MAELSLDPAIRLWVILPIVLMTFLVGIIRHYVSLLLQSDSNADIDKVQFSQAMMRSAMLRENGRFIPRKSFEMRRHFFNNPEDGYLKEKQESAPAPNMADPTMMTEMMKGNFVNVLPMLVIGGWINWTFSGFVTTKIPFPLTYRFKAMLQRGVELTSLDASWVSSASWYFLNVFGLRSVYTLILGQDNAADQTRAIAEQMAAPTAAASAGGMPPDQKKAFKAEWEALEIVNHKWSLQDVEESLLANSTVSSSKKERKDKDE
ncbi:uncharacterized protein TRIADDRAFT_25209 [Trichoplax adhaerens]|uniref:ER membrane protein complex subunit 3 n=1 Tax=Trichoplax adhaerens TaxID=10228 RepID=B3RWY2_TRIAD|nr:hypothetical protein TRIADDRAFT_25209 [Trichoplax adhaerens]EDV25212.1 hypothetical protein TRIADDRAFT_25209 [Trichoplax adhaerens]|eukprot:XP_002113102.1 hypothetical protein TRIADDRAFT_25209 [Trichoplax adhaerens]